MTLIGRVTEVRFYPATRPDGSQNYPNESNPPYFINQTEDWKNMMGDYQSCLDHSQEHWPL